MRFVHLAAVAAIGLAACSSAAADASDDDLIEGASVATNEPEPTATTAATTIPSTVAPSTAPAETTVPTTVEDRCSPWIIVGDAEVGRWFVVNDDVMGGRSLGGLLIGGDELRFTGAVNTDGGGFSSIRGGVDDGDLDGWSGVRITAVGDGRTYQFRARDTADGRNSRVTHRAEIVLGPGPVQVEVAFADMRPGVFGVDVDDTPLVPVAIDWIGIMIADGIDGEFDAVVTSIERCR